MYKPEYEGLGKVMCFNNIVYSADRSSATVEAKCRQASDVTSLSYAWNGADYSDKASFSADSSLADKELTLSVKADTGDQSYEITVQPVNFIW